jgi:hypothetical protein
MYAIKDLMPVEQADVTGGLAFEGVPDPLPTGTTLLGRQVSLAKMETYLDREGGAIAASTADAIDAHNSRGSEEEPDTGVHPYLQGLVSDEEGRAKGVEGDPTALPDDIKAATLAAAIRNEYDRATGVEIDLTQSVSSAVERINAVDAEIYTLETTINAVDGRVGNTSLNTSAQTATAAINEVLAKANEAYHKPNDGIPDTDLTEAVQTSLGAADSALQAVTVESGDGLDITGAGTAAEPLAISLDGFLQGLAGLVNPTDIGNYALNWDGAAFSLALLP